MVQAALDKTYRDIAIRDLSDEELVALSSDMTLSLSLDDLHVILNLFCVRAAQ